ncbi:MAG: hypothetical protein K0R71_712 [Bacillales bacterium]|nr:hypothetical protein [Bacillales bacterium]
MKIGKRDYIYIHLNEEDHFVASIGWKMQSFMKSIPYSLANLLLLNHHFDDVEEFDPRTKMNFINQESVNKFIQMASKENGLFSWLDFEDREDLGELSKTEIAEILYLSHMLDHINAPFFSKLNNKFVYLTDESSSYSKVYYRKWQYFIDTIGQFISKSLDDLRLEKNFLGFSKSSTFDRVPASVLSELIPLFKEGVVFSLSEVDHTKAGYAISIWVVGDFHHEDDLFEASRKIVKKKADAVLTLSKKMKTWNLNFS